MTSNIRPLPQSAYNEVLSLIQDFASGLGFIVKTESAFYSDIGIIHCNKQNLESCDYFRFELYAPTETRKICDDRTCVTVNNWSIVLNNMEMAAKRVLSLADPEFFQKFEEELNSLRD